MGVYTWTDTTLGLRLNPRIKKIVALVQEGKQPSLPDIEYLIDEATRYGTLKQRVNGESFKIKDMTLDDEYDLKEVLGEMLMELDSLYAHKIGRDGTYTIELTEFNPHTENNIEKIPYEKVEEEVMRAIRLVKDLQKSYDDNGDDLKVQGYFSYLKKLYGVEVIVTSETKTEDILPVILDKVVSVIESEAKSKQTTLNRLKKP